MLFIYVLLDWIALSRSHHILSLSLCLELFHQLCRKRDHLTGPTGICSNFIPFAWSLEQVNPISMKLFMPFFDLDFMHGRSTSSETTSLIPNHVDWALIVTA
jgi:hypothetical protein